tara:strand:+ start:435 stop:668 length:234 start_codon:yes stop_codon:yes gene_type:complete
MTYSKHNKTGLTKAMKSALKEIVGERFTYLRRQKLNEDLYTTFYVSASHIVNEQTQRFNRELGIHTNTGLNQFYKTI